MNFLMAVAVLPGLFLTWYVYNQDKIEKEPFSLLRNLFIAGICSLLPAIILEWAADYLLKLFFTPKTTLFYFMEFFFGVALVEEGCKYYFLKKYTWNHPAFDYRFDAIVYAVCVSMGFAVLENIGYVLEHGLEVGIVRAFTSIPGHAMFAIYMGYYYGLGKAYAVKGNSIQANSSLRNALWVPVLLHGFYDFCLADAENLAIVFFAFIGIMYYRTYRSLRQWSKEDRPINS